MTTRKWGESFLKSGLPLEHLTMVRLKSLGWHYYIHPQYSRHAENAETNWFELDLIATSDRHNKNTNFTFMIECKYHDLSRFWFFLPHEEYRWHFDDRVLNIGPLQTLAKPRNAVLLKLAPCSSGGIVIGEDGTKQDNAVFTAVQQLAHGFVPLSLSYVFAFHMFSVAHSGDLTAMPINSAFIPMIVTNATIYRLKSDISNLEAIREASSPGEIADELEWTWYYNDGSRKLRAENHQTIENHCKDHPDLVYRFPSVERRIWDLAERPNWIAIVNITALEKAAQTLCKAFDALDILDNAQLRKHARPRRQAR